MVNDSVTILEQYVKCNLKIIKLKKNCKTPQQKWKDGQGIKDVSQVKDCNVGIVCDKVIVFDADTREAVEFLEQLDEFRETTKVRTRRGKHFYFLKSDPFIARTEKIYQDEKNIRIDIKADNSYVVAPPSRIDSHVYTFERDLSQIKTLTLSEYGKLVQTIKDKLNLPTERKKEATKDTLKGKKIDLNKLKEILKKRYSKGVRQDIVLYTSALLRKNNVDKETCEKFIAELCFEMHDTDIKQRLSAVDATYEKDKTELKGVSGLIELGFGQMELNLVFGDDDDYEHVFDEFYMKDNILFERIEKQKNGTYIMIAPAVFINAILNNTDGFIEYEIRYRNKIFKTKSIKDIAEIEGRTGIAVVREKKFLEYLNKQAIKCKNEKRLYVNVGWNDDFSDFYHPARTNQGIWRHILHEKKAHYANQSDHFIKHIKDILREAKLASIVYLFSISALMNKIVDTNPSCLIITGLAGTGKTTVSKAACNIYYDTGKFELTMNATQTAIERIMSSMKDMTVLFDEVALKASNSELERLIFMTYSKTSKARSDKRLNINLNELNANLIITSEMSEQEELKRIGALRRMLYLSISSKDDFTDNFSELIEALKYKICFYYFTDFVRKIKDSNEFKSIIDFAEQNACGCQDIYNIAKSMFATLKMLELFYEQDFKQLKSTLSEILLKQEMQINERKNITSYFMNRFMEFIAINQNKFITNNDAKDVKSEVWGKLDDEHVYIITAKFNEFCRQNDLHTELVLKDLEKNNALVRQNARDRSYKTRILNMLARTYKIKMHATEL